MAAILEAFPWSGRLLVGAWHTIQLSAAAMAFGVVLAAVLSMIRTWRIAPVNWVIALFVEIIRNTPFLVQLYVVFFALPSLGIRLSPTVAAVSALSLNISAYATEIIRAGVESIPKGQVEAGRALGLRHGQVFSYVVFRPAMRAIYPALTSQFILLLLGSSVVSAISVQELTATANDIQSETFRTFEVYAIISGIYLLLSFMFQFVFDAIGRRVFSYPVGREK